MASTYLTEVLCSEESHVPNIRAKITELTNHLNALKSDVRTVVEDGSIQFNPLVKENNRLQSKAEELLKEMTTVEEELDGEVKQELTSVADELDNLSHSLKEVNVFLKTLKQLVDINSQLKSAREKMERQEFYECTKIIKSIQEMIKTNSEKLSQIKIFRILSQEVVLTYEQLIYQISEIWSQCVNVSQKENLTSSCDEVTICIDVQSEGDISQILKASHCLKTVLIEKKFSKTLLDILKEVIVRKSKLDVKVGSKATLIIQISKDEAKPNYLQVFQNIKTIFEFLKSHLNVEIDDNVTFLSKIGDYIADDFAESLIKNCLSETIPSNSKDLEKYKDVIENAKTFDDSLQEIGFRLGDSSSILNYAKNINVLFANKLCQSYLSKARMIMKKDLHNIVSSDDVISDVRILPAKARNILKMKMNIQDEVFSFPKCQISKQADEIMSLIKSMMDEVEKSLDLYAVRLFYTVRNIFEMYSAIVPLHHKKFLESLPQQTALFHNNCMYFAHNMINLTTEYFNKIPSILNDHFTILLEEAVVLRSLAAEMLEASVTNQRNQLIFILRDSGLAALNDNPKLDPNSEKSVRQCLRQLQLLQTVWGDVLPVNVYNRAIGFLLDSIVEEVIALIISVEDISSQTASDLVSIFRIVLERGPSLFPDAREVHRHSKKWQKFKEFILVLEGSLRDIDDRWANGMGPLAIEFTPEQVKHLIRALFQNSDRRAALLARIR